MPRVPHGHVPDRAAHGRDHPGGLHAQGRRRLLPEVPRTIAGDVVPVPHAGGAHLDQDLVRPRRRRCVKFTRPDVAAEAVDAGRPHGACHSGFRCPYAL
jgi:hypothetical protein